MNLWIIDRSHHSTFPWRSVVVIPGSSQVAPPPPSFSSTELASAAPSFTRDQPHLGTESTHRTHHHHRNSTTILSFSHFCHLYLYLYSAGYPKFKCAKQNTYFWLAHALVLLGTSLIITFDLLKEQITFFTFMAGSGGDVWLIDAMHGCTFGPDTHLK